MIGLQIDFETADRITVLNLKDCYESLSKENLKINELDPIREHNKEDLCYNTRMMQHIKEVLSYFGETL